MTLPAPRAPALLAWLRGRYRPDPAYPDGHVSSIYLDTFDLSLLREKINSDFVKQKVRVRWYGDPLTGAVLGPAFVELKRKVGGRRFKTRIAVDADPARIAGACVDPGYLRRLLEPLLRAGHQIPHDLRPFLRISFRRRRFVDPLSGSRISLDSTIRATPANPGPLHRAHPAPLGRAVVEVKGRHDTLPSALRRLGCRRESFSKYAQGYLRITRRSSF